MAEAALDTQQLPTSAPIGVAASKKLSLIPLISLIYFEVAGGPYGEEPTIRAAGPLFAILGFLIFPFVWCIPVALITAELSTMYPGNGGFVIWAERAFGSFAGSLMGTWKFLSGVINIAAVTSLCMQYLMRLFPLLSSGLANHVANFVFILVFASLNYTGLVIMGYFALALGILSLSPFLLMSLIAIPKLRPRRWISLGERGVKKDWNLLFNTLFWNLNYWDSVSTMAGEVENPSKTFPLALFIAVIFIALSYIIPLFAATGAIVVEQSEWEAGYMADVAKLIAGGWLKLWIEIGAVLSSIGLFEAQLSSVSYQLEGMADLALLPRFFAMRSKWFNTPWMGILLSALIALGVSSLSYTNLVSSANFLYSLGMLLEFASFLFLRWKLPQKRRSFRVPLRLPALSALSLIPIGMLLFIMVTATKTVFLLSGVMTGAGIIWFLFMRVVRARKWLRFDKVYNDEDD